jgi:hypothetical protein
VHETEAGARDMFEKYIRNYARSALDHYEFHNEGLADIPGYEYYGKLATNIRKHGIGCRNCKFGERLSRSTRSCLSNIVGLIVAG